MSSETDDTGSYYDAVGEMASVEEQNLEGSQEEVQGWDDDADVGAVAAATATTCCSS